MTIVSEFIYGEGWLLAVYFKKLPDKASLAADNSQPKPTSFDTNCQHSN
jgi:hypothetical protein